MEPRSSRLTPKASPSNIKDSGRCFGFRPRRRAPVTNHRRGREEAAVRIAIGCAVLGVMMLSPTVEGRGQEEPGGTVRVAAPADMISMDLVNASLDDVLKLLSQQAGMNFVASESARDRRVTVYLDQVPIQTAIRSILDANNLSFRQIAGSNVYIVGDSGGRAVKLTTKVYTLKYAR